MLFPIDLLERQVVHVPPEAIQMAVRALWRLGVSVRCVEGEATAVLRFGSKGSQDRAAIYLVEMQFASTRAEQRQWLEMCWHLPAFIPDPAASYHS